MQYLDVFNLSLNLKHPFWSKRQTLLTEQT